MREPLERSLADRLAVQRTELANERTLPAYIRTALALAGSGVGLLHLFHTPAPRGLGWGLLAVGVLLLLVGIGRFARASRQIRGS